jgi:hypothetical protein
MLRRAAFGRHRARRDFDDVGDAPEIDLSTIRRGPELAAGVSRLRGSGIRERLAVRERCERGRNESGRTNGPSAHLQRSLFVFSPERVD